MLPEALREARVPAGFGLAGAELAIAGRAASEWVRAAGDTPLFVYDRAIVGARIDAFRAAFPGVGLHYAVKANPHAGLLAWMAGRVDGFDVASAGELAMAAVAGAADVSFAGPAKRDRELAAAIDAGCVLNIESEGELRRAAAIAGARGAVARCALRINPPFELKGSGMRMGGRAAPFGIDAADAPAILRGWPAHARFEGFHIYAGSQCLDADALIAAQAETLALVAALAAHAPEPPRRVNLGGGFGAPYFPGDRALDVGAVGAALTGALARRPGVLAGTEFVIELGRWLVAECGAYLCRVIDRKTSGGKLFLTTDGGLHHQLAASGNFGTVIRRNYPLVNASRAADAPVEAATVVGCLCTPLDRLGEQVMLPETRPGDLIGLFMAGAYGRSASPEAFLGHPPPLEMLV